MKRVRLTERLRRKAADDETPFSGDVGNENRQDPKSDEYATDSWLVPGWELQDLNHEWKNDERDEVHIPVMKKASYAKIRRAASKAVKLAVLLLGDKVSERIIEAQARDFMRLGEKALDNALRRYARTEEVYAEGEEEKEAEGEEKVVDEVVEEGAKKKKKKSEDGEEEVEVVEEEEGAKKKKKSEDGEEEVEVVEEEGAKKKKKKSEDDDDDDDDDEDEAEE